VEFGGLFYFFAKSWELGIMLFVRKRKFFIKQDILWLSNILLVVYLKGYCPECDSCSS